MPNQSFTLKLSVQEEPRVKQFFLDQGFSFAPLDYAFWRAKGLSCTAAFYKSGKLLIQGPEADAWRRKLQGENESTKPYLSALAKHPCEARVWIGSDEAGKGDYFGPLVVAAFELTRDRVELLGELGIDDSKALNDARIREMAEQLRAIGPHAVVQISPARYNELHDKMGNINRILAWAHAKAIEELLAQGAVDFVLTDQFTALDTMRRSFGPLLANTRYEQRTKAEEDPAVAAASILARDAYMKALYGMAKRYALPLKPGAGADVVALTRRFAQQNGPNALREVAKVHFATTQSALGSPI